MEDEEASHKGRVREVLELVRKRQDRLSIEIYELGGVDGGACMCNAYEQRWEVWMS